MNISNGGPHLLLFERDQQLASLLTSELQLAGYECHTARTAVEVFDAIARFSVRLVLVNLAQAAAARREFWVALDTQRRGRGVQVFTFHCVNIAGYGARDPDERSQTTMADMEVDGMMGLMSLVDAVRARVPGPGSSTNTMPRMSRISASPPPTTPRPMSASPATNNTAYRSSPSPDSQSYQPSTYANVQPVTNLTQTVSQQPSAFATPSSDVGEASINQPSYTDRIRAVLYPNQKTWSSSTGLTPPPEVRTDQDLQRPAQNTGGRVGMSGTTALQRLASGQSDLDGTRGESGLAQLSRMLQDFRAPAAESTTSTSPLQGPEVTTYPTTSRLQAPAETNTFTGTLSVQPPQPIQQAAADVQAVAYSQQVAPTSSSLPVNSVEVRSPRQDESVIGMQPLRAAPIQDLMENRNPVGQANSEAYARLGHSQVATPVPPLSSISPIPASAPPPSYAPASAPVVSPLSTPVAAAVPMQEVVAPQRVEAIEEKKLPPPIEAANSERLADKQESSSYTNEELNDATMHGTPAAIMQEALNAVEGELSSAPNSATLIDIMESFPPMPPPKAQPPQPTVLNGRATRSLGSVLLAGHLVPENRLEVAQHIQRMLSGVDMNYQLGEILLMFKLLTPDQLLAASLVSYGLITTQQISALGRIRQELHAIGLEYDLENLLILFRILTPEQIREAKSNRQS
jgi:hypothetical protein